MSGIVSPLQGASFRMDISQGVALGFNVFAPLGLPEGGVGALT
jgi:hypothetical protein